MLRSLRLFPAALPLLACCLHAQKSPSPPYDPTPRIGVLIPKGPPDYALWYDNLINPITVNDGAFRYTTGTISGVAVAITVQPTDGEVMRALGAITMIHDFNLLTGQSVPIFIQVVGSFLISARILMRRLESLRSRL